MLIAIDLSFSIRLNNNNYNNKRRKINQRKTKKNNTNYDNRKNLLIFVVFNFLFEITSNYGKKKNVDEVLKSFKV